MKRLAKVATVWALSDLAWHVFRLIRHDQECIKRATFRHRWLQALHQKRTGNR